MIRLFFYLYSLFSTEKTIKCTKIVLLYMPTFRQIMRGELYMASARESVSEALVREAKKLSFDQNPKFTALIIKLQQAESDFAKENIRDQQESDAGALQRGAHVKKTFEQKIKAHIMLAYLDEYIDERHAPITIFGKGSKYGPLAQVCHNTFLVTMDTKNSAPPRFDGLFDSGKPKDKDNPNKYPDTRILGSIIEPELTKKLTLHIFKRKFSEGFAGDKHNQMAINCDKALYRFGDFKLAEGIWNAEITKIFGEEGLSLLGLREESKSEDAIKMRHKKIPGHWYLGNNIRDYSWLTNLIDSCRDHPKDLTEFQKNCLQRTISELSKLQERRHADAQTVKEKAYPIIMDLYISAYLSHHDSASSNNNYLTHVEKLVNPFITQSGNAISHGASASAASASVAEHSVHKQIFSNLNSKQIAILVPLLVNRAIAEIAGVTEKNEALVRKIYFNAAETIVLMGAEAVALWNNTVKSYNAPEATLKANSTKEDILRPMDNLINEKSPAIAKAFATERQRAYQEEQRKLQALPASASAAATIPRR
jgi:hypothetical protein